MVCLMHNELLPMDEMVIGFAHEVRCGQWGIKESAYLRMLVFFLPRDGLICSFWIKESDFS